MLRVLHLRLSVLRPVVTARRTKWIALGILLNWLLVVSILIGQVLSVIDGTGALAALQTPKKGKKGIGDIISTASFTLLVWCLCTLNGMARNKLLLPDHVSILIQIKLFPRSNHAQVLSILSGRLILIFGIRALYIVVNTALPSVFSYPFRLFRPDVEFAIDGAIWILTCYALIGLLKPDTNCARR